MTERQNRGEGGGTKRALASSETIAERGREEPRKRAARTVILVKKLGLTSDLRNGNKVASYDPSPNGKKRSQGSRRRGSRQRKTTVLRMGNLAAYNKRNKPRGV